MRPWVPAGAPPCASAPHAGSSPSSSCCSPISVPSAGPCCLPRSLSRLHVERLRSLLTRPRLELDLFALAKLLELDARAETRAVKEHLFRPVVRRDEAEALLPHDALDRSGHGTLVGGFQPSPRTFGKRPLRVASSGQDHARMAQRSPFRSGATSDVPAGTAIR